MSSCLAPSCPLPAEIGAVFCATHLQASPARRGGWLSAARRRRRLGNSDMPLEASNITKRLWIGSKPPFDRDLPDFDVLVLCAEELQPNITAFHGRVIHVPLPDAKLSGAELERALAGGRAVAAALARGQRVLVTCQMGRNRSALVAALGLGLLTRMSASRIIELIRARRNPDCLSNPYFCLVLQTAIGDGRMPVRGPRP